MTGCFWLWGAEILVAQCVLLVCFCLQLEETQTKRHDQLVEQYNELLQEIQDLKPKVLWIDPFLLPLSNCASVKQTPGSVCVQTVALCGAQICLLPLQLLPLTSRPRALRSALTSIVGCCNMPCRAGSNCCGQLVALWNARPICLSGRRFFCLKSCRVVLMPAHFSWGNEGESIWVSTLLSLSSCKAPWRPTSRRSSSACQVRSRTSCRTGKPRSEVTASRGHPRRTRRCQRRTERERWGSNWAETQTDDWDRDYKDC